MDEKLKPAAQIRTWMLKVLGEHPELSAASWAKRAGVAASTVQRAIKPTYQFTTSSVTLSKLAAVVSTEAPEIRATRDLQIVPHYLPVRYKVQAGHWYEPDFEEPPAPYSGAVVPDPRYGQWPQWLELVVGDSINLKIQPGSYAHVVDAFEMGYVPKTGDYVVVERHRDQGAIRERTIKQVAKVTTDEVELCPRSTNPKWTQPVNMKAGTRDGEEVEGFIVGLVIGSYDPHF